METYTTRLEKSGRILLPTAVRRQLGLSAIRVTSRFQALAQAREEIRKYIPAGRDLVAELIRDRRAEGEQ